MTNEKAKYLVSACGLNIESGLHEQVLTRVINALDKQTEKTVVAKMELRDIDNGYERDVRYFCPNCGGFLCVQHHREVVDAWGGKRLSRNVEGVKGRYCHECGQLLDWEGGIVE